MRIASLRLDGAFVARTGPFGDAEAQWRNRDKKSGRRPGTPVACVLMGRVPIQPGCRIETGFTPDGMLSGDDSVVCPAR